MLKIDEKSSVPIYLQIYENIIELIVLGVLVEGEKLMSVRELALILNINPNTIQKSYKLLESKKIIKSVKGKGNYIKNSKEVVNDYVNNLEKLIIDSSEKLLKVGKNKDEIIKIIDSIEEGYKND